MARRKKIGELKDSEIECGYCDAIIPVSAQKCPNCGKYFSSFKKLMAFTVVAIVVLASMLVFVYGYYNGGQQGYIPQITPINIDPDNPDQPSADGKTIIFELKEADAPNTCANFKRYVQDEFFDGLIFHRVMDDFMIQGGGFNPDMTQKTPTYPPINLEISQNLRHTDGAVAMARTSDENSATAQFYICDGPQSMLDNSYAVFGQVVSGMDVVRAIAALDPDYTHAVGSHANVPINDVTIISARLGTQDGKTYVTLVVDF